MAQERQGWIRFTNGLNVLNVLKRPEDEEKEHWSLSHRYSSGTHVQPGISGTRELNFFGEILIASSSARKHEKYRHLDSEASQWREGALPVLLSSLLAERL